MRSLTKNYKRFEKTHTIRYTKNWFTHLKIYIYNGALAKTTQRRQILLIQLS
jgi:hypothetical protein